MYFNGTYNFNSSAFRLIPDSTALCFWLQYFHNYPHLILAVSVNCKCLHNLGCIFHSPVLLQTKALSELNEPLKKSRPRLTLSQYQVQEFTRSVQQVPANRILHIIIDRQLTTANTTWTGFTFFYQMPKNRTSTSLSASKKKAAARCAATLSKSDCRIGEPSMNSTRPWYSDTSCLSSNLPICNESIVNTDSSLSSWLPPSNVH